jgi:hypothetical protein
MLNHPSEFHHIIYKYIIPKDVNEHGYIFIVC